MFIAIVHSVSEKKSNIIAISDDELVAIDSLVGKSVEISEKKEYRVNIIDKRTIHVYHDIIGYVTSSTKLSYILEILEYVVEECTNPE